MNQKTRNWVLLGGDFIVMYMALAIALAVRGGLPMVGHFWDEYFFPFTILNFAWVCVFFIADFYSYRGLKLNIIFVQTLSIAMAANVVLTVIFFYVVTAFGLTPKTYLMIYVIIFMFLFCLWRWFFGRAATGSNMLEPVVFMEVGDVSAHLAEVVLNDPTSGYRLAGIIQTREDINLPAGVPVSADPRDTWRFFGEEGGLVVVGNAALAEARELLYSLLRRGVTVVDAASFWEDLHAEVPINVADTAWFLNHYPPAYARRLYALAKRTADLTMAVLMAVFALPLTPFIALAIKLASPGPVIFGQDRVGYHGRVFRLYKFRSMRCDAEKDGAQWSVKGDRRVTAVGTFLRHTHLDELPQLWNILRGEMSFIGPRPERPEFVSQLDQAVPFYDLRHLVKPGISGWAQINYRYGCSVEDAARKLAYDLYYVKNQSAFLDIKILLKTIIMVFRGEGR